MSRSFKLFFRKDFKEKLSCRYKFFNSWIRELKPNNNLY